MNDTALLLPAHRMEELSKETFWMDHMIAGEESEGDYCYEGSSSLPTIGSSVHGFYYVEEDCKPYIFRVIGICFYEFDASEPRHSKSIGAILIDPVMENYIREAPSNPA
jgi:hypothetical protein